MLPNKMKCCPSCSYLSRSLQTSCNSNTHHVSRHFLLTLAHHKLINTSISRVSLSNPFVRIWDSISRKKKCFSVIPLLTSRVRLRAAYCLKGLYTYSHVGEKKERQKIIKNLQIKKKKKNIKNIIFFNLTIFIY